MIHNLKCTHILSERGVLLYECFLAVGQFIFIPKKKAAPKPEQPYLTYDPPEVLFYDQFLNSYETVR